MMPTRLLGTESDEIRADVFHQIVSILETNKSKLDFGSMITCLCEHVNLSLLSLSTCAEWLKSIDDQWCDPSNFNIKSWHGSDGQAIANTSVVGDINILKPLGDDVTPLAVNARRLNDIAFANVSVTFDFGRLVPVDKRPCVFPVEFYIELPQATVQIRNGHNVVGPITSFVGPSDICTLTPAVFKTTILDPCRQTKLISLNPPAFNQAKADIDRTDLFEQTQEAVLGLSWPFIKASVF